MTKGKTNSTLAISAVALALGMSAASAQDITIGFVAHAQGDPFVQQIQDGAQAAANDPPRPAIILKLLCKTASGRCWQSPETACLAFPQQVPLVLRQQPCPKLNEQPGVGSF